MEEFWYIIFNMNYLGKMLKVNSEIYGLPPGTVIALVVRQITLGKERWYTTDFIIKHSGDFLELSQTQIDYGIMVGNLVLYEGEVDSIDIIEEEDHEGMVYNEYTGKWSWF